MCRLFLWLPSGPWGRRMWVGIYGFCTTLSSIFLVSSQSCPWRITCDLVQTPFVSQSPRGSIVSYLPTLGLSQVVKNLPRNIIHLFGLYGLACWKKKLEQPPYSRQSSVCIKTFSDSRKPILWWGKKYLANFGYEVSSLILILLC